MPLFNGVDPKTELGKSLAATAEVNARLAEETTGNTTIVRSNAEKKRQPRGSGHGCFATESTKRPCFISQKEEQANWDNLDWGNYE